MAPFHFWQKLLKFWLVHVSSNFCHNLIFDASLLHTMHLAQAGLNLNLYLTHLSGTYQHHHWLAEAVLQSQIQYLHQHILLM